MSSIHFFHTITESSSKLTTVISGSDNFANNISSSMSSRNTCCSHQISTLPSNADMRFRCSTDLLYASTLTSRNANVIAGPYMTVTNSVAPLINAKGSVLIAKLRSVSRGMPQHDVARLLPSQSFHPLLFQSDSAAGGTGYEYVASLISYSRNPWIVSLQTSSRSPSSAPGSASNSSILPSFHALSQSTLEVHLIANSVFHP